MRLVPPSSACCRTGIPIHGLMTYRMGLYPKLSLMSSTSASPGLTTSWTPWFSIFGSKSGFDSVEECFGDQTKHIYALETGLSSDPAMNWRLSDLDGYTLLSNSDPHSPYSWRLGREANAFSMRKLDYRSLTDAIKTRRGFEFTIEVPPAYGKYHHDGHRNCNINFEPKETRERGGKCPRCGKGW